MAQTGYTPILIYSSSTVSQAPAAGNLTNSTLGSELAINITDGKLFYKDNANAVQVIGWKTVPTTAGGTGLTSYTAGDLVYYASGTTLTKLAIGASGRWLGSSGTAPQWNAPAALTKTDDTNVTLTLGGSASTALLNAASLTLGWTGTLAVGRGGTGASTFTAGRVLFGNGTSAINTSGNLFWDNANSRLGINTASPSSSLDVAGVLNATTTGAFSPTATFAQTASTGGVCIVRSQSSTAYIDLMAGGVTYATNYMGANEAGLITQDVDDMRFNIGGTFCRWTFGATEQMRLTNTGNLSLVSGNLVVSTSGKGIDFSATAGTGTSELLADYEEGTFNPTVIGSSTAGTVTYANQIGRYTKVGRLVTVEIYLNWNSGTGTGNLQFGGLPFTMASGNYGAVSLVPENIALTAGNILVGRILSGATYIEPLQTPTGGGGLNTVPYDAAGNIMITASYSV